VSNDLISEMFIVTSSLVKVSGGGTGVVICLERGANDLHIVQLMPLPPHHLLLQQNPEAF